MAKRLCSEARVDPCVLRDYNRFVTDLHSSVPGLPVSFSFPKALPTKLRRKVVLIDAHLLPRGSAHNQRNVHAEARCNNALKLLRCLLYPVGECCETGKGNVKSCKPLAGVNVAAELDASHS